MTWGWWGSSRVVHQVRYAPPVTPKEHGLPWEPLHLVTADQISISGWLIRRPAPKGIVILLHGFGTCKADLLDLAVAFHQRGAYHLVLIDFRGHGESHGSLLSFGKYEILDIQAVLDFLQKEPALRDLPVGCYGVSMGGAIGLLAAAEHKQIQAVVSDSAYADLAKAIARTQWAAYHIPRIPLGQMVIWTVQLRLGCRMRALSPVHRIGGISPRGVFIIHGTKDRGISPAEAHTLYEAAREPKRLWIVPGAEHIGSFFLKPEEYIQQVTGFFDHAFRRTA